MPIPSDCFARHCSEFMIVDLVMSPALILSDQYKKFLGFVLNIVTQHLQNAIRILF